MSSSSTTLRARAWFDRPWARALLAVAVLVPVTVLFAVVRNHTTDERASGQKERAGVEYLSTLWPVLTALADTESAIVAGRATAADALARAVDAAGTVDGRLGDRLQSHERWSGLRAKIESLPSKKLTTADDVVTAYSEATDLALALFQSVQENSGLVLDSEASSYFLQDAGAEELPQAVVAAGRLADLAVVAPSRAANQRTQTFADAVGARLDVVSPGSDVIEDLQAAATDVAKTSFSDDMLRRIEAFQRATDELSLVSQPNTNANRAVLDSSGIAAARATMQTAATELHAEIMDELDSVLTDRLAELTRQNQLSITMLAVAIMLLVLLVITGVLAGRRDAGSGRRPARGGPAASTGADTTRTGEFGTPPGWPTSGPNAGYPPLPVNSPAIKDDAGIAALVSWEKSGAAR